MPTTQNLEQPIQAERLWFSVKQFVQRHPAITNGGLRALIFNEKNNGLAKSGAIIRLGRKLVIDEAKFFAWVDARNGGGRV